MWRQTSVTFPVVKHHRPQVTTKLYCLVTEAQKREQLAQFAVQKWGSEELNPWDVDHMSSALTTPPLSHTHNAKTFPGQVTLPPSKLQRQVAKITAADSNIRTLIYNSTTHRSNAYNNRNVWKYCWQHLYILMQFVQSTKVTLRINFRKERYFWTKFTVNWHEIKVTDTNDNTDETAKCHCNLFLLNVSWLNVICLKSGEVCM